MKNIKLLLISLNVILFVLIYFSFSKENDTTELKTIRKITNLTKLTELNIQNSKGNITIRKKKFDWVIDSPINWKIDNFAMSSFLTTLSHLKIKKLFDEKEIQKRGEMLDDYGIGSNSTILELHNNKEIITFKLGKNTRDNKSVYCGIKETYKDNFEIYRISKEINDVVERSFEEWADSSLVRSSLYKLNKISTSFKSVNNSIFETSLEQKDKQWEFTKPFTAEANNEEVRLLLNRLLNEQIKDYFPKIDANMSTSNAEENWKLKLELSSEDENHIFYIRDLNQSLSSDYLICKSNRSNHLFTLDKSFISDLSDWSTKLRERRIVRAQEEIISEISVTNQFSSFKLINQNEQDWFVSDDKNDTTKADGENIQLFLNQLNSFKIKEFISFNPSISEFEQNYSENSNFSLKIKYKNTDQQTILVKSNDNDATLWKTLLVEESLLCLVEDNWSKILNKKAFEFKERLVLNQVDHIDNITILNLENNSTIYKTKDNNNSQYKFLKNFKVISFLGDESKSDGTWIDGDWVPWKYQIDIKYGENKIQDNYTIKSFMLSDLIKNQGWIGNFINDKHTFLVPIEIVEEIMKLVQKSI